MCYRAETALPCEAASVAQARHWVRDQLAAAYDRLDGAADDLALVVSELVTNCLRADAHQFGLAVEAHHTTVRVEASDDAPGLPVMRRAPPDALHGRGLRIVDQLSTRWGVETHGGSKTVWAEVPVPSGVRPSFDCTFAAG